jgi:hypothetical protein
MNIRECRHIINYDMKEHEEKHRKYLYNLHKLKEKYNNNIEITTLNTLKDKRAVVYSKLVRKVRTPYILMWEHDFILERVIDLNKIVDSMDKYKSINFIRFNKRDNYPIERVDIGKFKLGNYYTSFYRPLDYWMKEETNIKDIPLIKFCGYGGVPHIERREWFNRYCRPLITLNPAEKHNSIERAVNFDIYEKRQLLGFDRAHEMLGTYIYGRLGDKGYVKSLDEFKSREAWGDKKPSKEWLEFNEV